MSAASRQKLVDAALSDAFQDAEQRRSGELPGGHPGTCVFLSRNEKGNLTAR